ncbi:Ras family protein [Wuchereria bancrofti]|nr:Ras family protein [Wuchereria bancrofti]
MERYRTIYNSYYHSAHGVMCVYDLTDERSFDNLRNYWLKEIRLHAPSNAVLMLIGNKADLEDKRMVNFERAERLANQLGVSLYEVSAKTGINCDDAFYNLAAAMRDRLSVSSMHSDSEDSDHLGSAFHVDGVTLPDKNSSFLPSCCSSVAQPTFV